MSKYICDTCGKPCSSKRMSDDRKSWQCDKCYFKKEKKDKTTDKK